MLGRLSASRDMLYVKDSRRGHARGGEGNEYGTAGDKLREAVSSSQRHPELFISPAKPGMLPSLGTTEWLVR